MSQATDYMEEKVLDAIASLGSIDFASGTVTAGSGGYIGLFTSAPSDSSAGTEVSASGTAYTSANWKCRTRQLRSSIQW